MLLHLDLANDRYNCVGCNAQIIVERDALLAAVPSEKFARLAGGGRLRREDTRKRFQIASYEEASRMFCAARDKMGEGASRTPSPKIVDERGDVIGHVSYNGRVWAGASYVADAVPLYDNR